jgi:hypothetical protein
MRAPRPSSLSLLKEGDEDEGVLRDLRLSLQLNLDAALATPRLVRQGESC